MKLSPHTCTNRAYSTNFTALKKSNTTSVGWEYGCSTTTITKVYPFSDEDVVEIGKNLKYEEHSILNGFDEITIEQLEEPLSFSKEKYSLYLEHKLPKAEALAIEDELIEKNLSNHVHWESLRARDAAKMAEQERLMAELKLKKAARRAEIRNNIDSALSNLKINKVINFLKRIF
jgi:hypothetical protein